MADAAAVIRTNGIVADPGDVIRAAHDAGLELAVMCAKLIKESRGKNIYGHDPVPTGGTYTKGGPVTEANYKAYRAWRKAGSGRLQGVGPAQLTFYAFQDQADALGGCWVPRINMQVGAMEMARCIRAGGDLRNAGALYNGGRKYTQASTAAQAYGRDLEAKTQQWRRLLSGASTNVPTVVTSGGTYTVRSGDTLSGIAARYPGVTWRAIADANKLADPDRLQLGQVLRIPNQTPPPAPSVPEEDDMPSKEEVADEVVGRLLGALLRNPYTQDPGDAMNVGDQISWGTAHAARAVDGANAVLARLAGLEAAIGRLSGANAAGTAVDPAALQQAVRDGVAQALADSVHVTGDLHVTPRP